MLSMFPLWQHVVALAAILLPTLLMMVYTGPLMFNRYSFLSALAKPLESRIADVIVRTRQRDHDRAQLVEYVRRAPLAARPRLPYPSPPRLLLVSCLLFRSVCLCLSLRHLPPAIFVGPRLEWSVG